jgi:hypothetical protein
MIWKATGSVTRATLWAARVGAGMALLLMAYGFWEVFAGDIVGGVWLVFIAWFIRHAARTAYRQHLMSTMQQASRDSLEAHYQGARQGPYSVRAVWTRPIPGPGHGADPRETGGRDVTHLGGSS